VRERDKRVEKGARVKGEKKGEVLRVRKGQGLRVGKMGKG
jgi:hypothetical protein